MKALKRITRNVDEADVIGRGGIGKVYRGEWMDRGTGPVSDAIVAHVAVKRVCTYSYHGYEEWMVSTTRVEL